jgi:hypothetical protein
MVDEFFVTFFSFINIFLTSLASQMTSLKEMRFLLDRAEGSSSEWMNNQKVLRIIMTLRIKNRLLYKHFNLDGDGQLIYLSCHCLSNDLINACR